MTDPTLAEVIDIPKDVVQRFPLVHYKGKRWDLSHLESIAFRCAIGPGKKLEVVVHFTCHCFTHSLGWDSRRRHQIPQGEIYNDGTEVRVLCPVRYELSLILLRGMTTDLPNRPIFVANVERQNYMTWKIHNADGTPSVYAVFFDVARDKKRKGRVILRIQSAYILDDGLSRRQRGARKVSFGVLIKATYEGRKIKP